MINMIKKIFCTQLIIIYVSMLIAGFLIGFGYSLLGSQKAENVGRVDKTVGVEQLAAGERSEK